MNDNQKLNKFQQDFLLLTGSVFVVVALWVGFSIYNTHVTSTIDETLQLNILPINGQFDAEALSKIRSRKVVEPEYANPLEGKGEETPAEEPPAEEPPPAEETPIEETTPVEEQPTEEQPAEQPPALPTQQIQPTP